MKLIYITALTLIFASCESEEHKQLQRNYDEAKAHRIEVDRLGDSTLRAHRIYRY